MSDVPKMSDFNLPKFNPKQIRLFIFGFIAIFIAATSFYTVGANENAVILRLGKYLTTTGPGLQFKFPLVDEIYKVKVDYQYKKEFGFRTLKANVRTQFKSRGYEDESGY